MISTTQSDRKKSFVHPQMESRRVGGRESRGSEANKSPRNCQDESKLKQQVPGARGLVGRQGRSGGRATPPGTASLLMSRRLWVCQGVSAQPGTGMATVPAPGTTRQRACCTGW